MKSASLFMTPTTHRAFVMKAFKNSKKLLFGKLFLGLLAVMAMGLMQVDAQITGPFVEGSGSTQWTLGYNDASGTHGPIISLLTGNLEITQNLAGTEGTSGYYNTKQDISNSFSASFTWTLNTAAGADGFLFSIQNSSLTPLAGRGYMNGSALGYSSGVSIGLENYVGSAPQLQLVVNGSTTSVDLSTSGLNYVTAGKIINFNIAYNGSNSFSVDLTQAGASTFHHDFALGSSLASKIGASTSYVGFTGGAGGARESQIISNFNMVPEPGTWMLLALTGTFFMVTRRRRRD